MVIIPVMVMKRYNRSLEIGYFRGNATFNIDVCHMLKQNEALIESHAVEPCNLLLATLVDLYIASSL